MRYLVKVSDWGKIGKMGLPFTCLNVSNTIGSLEVMASTVDGQDAGGSKASGLSIRLVDCIVIDTDAVLKKKTG